MGEISNPGNYNTGNEYQNIVNEYQNIISGYQNINDSGRGATHNWLVVFGGLFSFFILLYILSQIIE